MDMEKKITNFYPNILITGTPGVGKTSMSVLLADELSDKLGKQFKAINVGEIIRNKKLYEKWNEEFDVPEFDDDKVIDALEPSMQEGFNIVDFHSGCFFPEEWFSLVVLLRCNNTDLYDRLKARNYTEKKITENIQCEIMEITADEVKESYGSERILELANEKIDDMQANIDKIVEYFLKLNPELK